VRKDRRVPLENVRLDKHSVRYAFAASLGVVGSHSSTETFLTRVGGQKLRPGVLDILTQQ